jgi:uncharacterized protein (TIGR00369 family)
MSRQESYSGCFVCGPDNPAGLHAEFHTVSENEVEGTFRPQPHHCGYQGVLHGAVVMGLLDETLGRLATARGRLFLTHSLTVTFRKAGELGDVLSARARLVEWNRRDFTAEGEITNSRGEVVATASGRFWIMSERMEHRFRTRALVPENEPTTTRSGGGEAKE